VLKREKKVPAADAAHRRRTDRKSRFSGGVAARLRDVLLSWRGAMAFSGSFEQFGAKAPWEKNLVSGHYRGGASERKEKFSSGLDQRTNRNLFLRE
jgi:hypothetical protein